MVEQTCNKKAIKSFLSSVSDGGVKFSPTSDLKASFPKDSDKSR